MTTSPLVSPLLSAGVSAFLQGSQCDIQFVRLCGAWVRIIRIVKFEYIMCTYNENDSPLGFCNFLYVDT